MDDPTAELKAAMRARLLRWGLTTTHVLTTIGVVVGVFALLAVFDASFHADVTAAVSHVLQMAIFLITALVLGVFVLYVIVFTPVQKIALPQIDILLDVERKWRSGKTPSEPELRLAQAAAVSSGLRVLGLFLFLGIVSTPL